MTISHVHDTQDKNAPIHEGSLADCPESTWTEVLLDDGRKARFYHGMSISMPPDTTQRLRYIDKVEKIS